MFQRYCRQLFRTLGARELRIGLVAGSTGVILGGTIAGPVRDAYQKGTLRDSFEEFKGNPMTPVECFKRAYQAQYQQKDCVLAMKYYKKVLSFTPKYNEIDFFHKAADILLDHDEIEAATQYWRRTFCTNREALSKKLEKTADKLFKLGRDDEAWAYLDEVYKMGAHLVSKDNLKPLARKYLTSRNLRDIERSIFMHSLFLVSPHDENEFGVALMMKALFNKNLFSEYKDWAISCFDSALKRDPNLVEARQNLEIAEILTNYPEYRSPQSHLNFKDGCSTMILDSIRASLRPDTLFPSTLRLIDYDEPRHFSATNEEALKALAELERKWASAQRANNEPSTEEVTTRPGM